MPWAPKGHLHANSSMIAQDKLQELPDRSPTPKSTENDVLSLVFTLRLIWERSGPRSDQYDAKMRKLAHLGSKLASGSLQFATCCTSCNCPGELSRLRFSSILFHRSHQQKLPSMNVFAIRALASSHYSYSCLIPQEMFARYTFNKTTSKIPRCHLAR